MLVEGFAVATLAEILKSMASFFKQRTTMDNTKSVRKHIVDAVCKFGRELFIHGIAIYLIFNAHSLFIPGDTI